MTSGISLGSELEVPAWNLSVLSRPEKCDIAIFSFFGDKIRGGKKRDIRESLGVRGSDGCEKGPQRFSSARKTACLRQEKARLNLRLHPVQRMQKKNEWV